jgi:hypothetical protein
LNSNSIDNTTTAKMPKEVKQKSGLIVGLNKGHSTFARPPHSALDNDARQRKHVRNGTLTW